MVSRSFQITPVRSPGDIAIAARLFQAYAASLPIDLGYQDFEAELAELPGKYAPPNGELLLARGIDASPLGCVALRPLDDRCCEMKRLFVLPASRGLGVGQALVETVIAAATRIGYREMRLDTLPSMAGAIGLYAGAGFVPIPAYYQTPIGGTIFLGRSLAP
jgi:GNAT superfamily N-acetyltransferase